MTILNGVVYLYIVVYSCQMVTLSYLISDETLEPRAFNIPASSTAIYPAPMTATFLMVKQKKYHLSKKEAQNGYDLGGKSP